MPIYHLVAKTTDFTEPFTDGPTCREIWKRLREIFPETLACCLMPNHLHLITKLPDSSGSGNLGRLLHLNRMTRTSSFNIPSDSRPIGSLFQLRSQIRYVHLNPCRKGWAEDPFCWPWSTYRDYFSLVREPWVTDLKVQNFRNLEELHAFTSADLSTRLEGTPALSTPASHSSILGSGKSVLLAASNYLRQDPNSKPVLNLAIQLLYREEGWTSRKVGEALGVSEWTARRCSCSAPPSDIQALRTLLCDPRLLRAHKNVRI